MPDSYLLDTNILSAALRGEPRMLLNRLANEGWRSVIGASIDAAGHSGLGWDTVVERSDEFDPFSFDQPAAPR